MKTEYILLDSNDKIESQCRLWQCYDKIAVDFECEFNLHVYGEHLCLIQIYDGNSYFIIDPRSKNVTEKGLLEFFSTKTKKLWFDCQSDQALVYKNYGLKIENIVDLRVIALALGFQGNLIALEKEYLGIEIKINKKKNQQANWMKRPLDEENLEYALLDVAHLIDLEPVLLEKAKERGLLKSVEKNMRHATELKKPEPGWMKIGSWRHYNDRQRLVVKNLFIERDKIARRFNVPPAHVMDKHKIIDFALNTPNTEAETAKRLSVENPRFIKFLVPAVINALKQADIEYMEKAKRS